MFVFGKQLLFIKESGLKKGEFNIFLSLPPHPLPRCFSAPFSPLLLSSAASSLNDLQTPPSGTPVHFAGPYSDANGLLPDSDYYTTALLKDNTAANQYTLLTLLVNTVVIGNYTQPNMNAVPGILAPGMFNGKNVNLLPYFNGALASSNRGNKATAVNFLDGGGAEPLKKNMPANDQTSNQ